VVARRPPDLRSASYFCSTIRCSPSEAEPPSVTAANDAAGKKSPSAAHRRRAR
jgi:hypothetical protein